MAVSDEADERFFGLKEMNARLALYGWLFSVAVLLGARGLGALFSLEAFALLTVGSLASVYVFGFATFALQRGSAIVMQQVVLSVWGKPSSVAARFINGFGLGLFAANLAMVWWGASVSTQLLLGPSPF